MEITKENLKEEAVKAHYQAEQEKALNKIKREAEEVIERGNALKELMEKFPGITTEQIGDKVFYDILGYKFAFGKEVVFWNQRKTEVPWGFGRILSSNYLYLHEATVKSIEGLGNLIANEHKDAWNYYYNQFKKENK